MIGQQKSSGILYNQSQDFTGKPVITFEIQMCIRIILEFFEKYTCPGIDILLQSSRCLSNEQPCLKTTELYDYLLLFFQFVSLFLFHIKCSHFIQFIFSNFSISSFSCSFSRIYQAQQKSFCTHTYISMYNTYILEKNF